MLVFRINSVTIFVIKAYLKERYFYRISSLIWPRQHSLDLFFKCACLLCLLPIAFYLFSSCISLSSSFSVWTCFFLSCKSAEVHTSSVGFVFQLQTALKIRDFGRCLHIASHVLKSENVGNTIYLSYYSFQHFPNRIFCFVTTLPKIFALKHVRRCFVYRFFS